MLNATLLFLILRILTFVPGVILLIFQGNILIKKWGNHNGMKPYRILLFLFTLAFVFDSLIVGFGDYLQLFNGIGHGDYFPGITPLRFLARIIELSTIIFFYDLIYRVKHNE